VRDEEGLLCLAKFPSRQDRREKLTNNGDFEPSPRRRLHGQPSPSIRTATFGLFPLK
jgi:hypothetical protein